METGRTKLTFSIDAQLKKRLKILSINRGTTVGELIAEAVQTKWFSDSADCTENPELS